MKVPGKADAARIYYCHLPPTFLLVRNERMQQLPTNRRHCTQERSPPNLKRRLGASHASTSVWKTKTCRPSAAVTLLQCLAKASNIGWPRLDSRECHSRSMERPASWSSNVATVFIKRTRTSLPTLHTWYSSSFVLPPTPPRIDKMDDHRHQLKLKERDHEHQSGRMMKLEHQHQIRIKEFEERTHKRKCDLETQKVDTAETLRWANE